MDTATPLFILGKHRSGTTGLANHLCEHSEIAGVQHEAHGGVHESAYFSHVCERYEPLETKTDFREFVEVMSASDYFRLTGVSKEYMLSLWPVSLETFFRKTMDRFAEHSDARFWLEKTPDHTKNAEELAAFYPDARFVGIVRNARDVVVSTLAKNSNLARTEGGIGLLSIARHVFSNAYYGKTLHRLTETMGERMVLVEYERFCLHKQEVLKEICQFLGTEFEEGMTDERYERNASSESRKEEVLGTRARRFVFWASEFLSGMIPLPLYRQIVGIRDSVSGDGRALPEWFFKLSEAERERS